MSKAASWSCFNNAATILFREALMAFFRASISLVLLVSAFAAGDLAKSQPSFKTGMLPERPSNTSRRACAFETGVYDDI